jgi:hypothetical protein
VGPDGSLPCPHFLATILNYLAMETHKVRLTAALPPGNELHERGNMGAIVKGNCVHLREWNPKSPLDHPRALSDLAPRHFQKYVIDCTLTHGMST